MPKKRPKYKKGYTWTHHFDEWWDRRDAAFKAKIFCFGVLGLVLAAWVGIYWGYSRFEKKDLIRTSVETKSRKIQDSDKSIRRIAHEEPHLPAFQSARSSDVRPGSED
jgi:hypothetical protein